MHIWKFGLAVGLLLGLAATLVACATAQKDPVTTTQGAAPSPTTAVPATIEPPVSYEEQVLEVAEHLDDIFDPLGRTYVNSEGQFQMDFACSGIRFAAECEGDVRIEINTHRTVRFTVYIDGVRSNMEPVLTDAKGLSVRIARDLPRGYHEFCIVDATQFIWGNASFGSVTVQGNFLPKPAQRELFLEFYGDSILNGSNVRMGGSSVQNSDSTQAFGWLTAQKLNADMSLVGCGGIGLTKNKRSFWMKDIIEYCGAQYSLPTNSPDGHLLPGIPKYSFERIPDAVIIEQGVNDGSNATQPIFRTELTNMIHLLREKYGTEVPIVLLTGYTAGKYYNSSIPTIVADLGGESAGLYICKLSNASATTAMGGDGTHPNIETSERMATELAAFLEKLLAK